MQNRTPQYVLTGRGLLTLVLLCSAVITSGCAGALLAVGAGAGAFSYVHGNLSKTYRAEYHQSIRAGKNALRDLNIRITGQTSDGLKTVIKGQRGDGTPVTIEVRRESPRLTLIGVRTGVVGLADRNASEQIHGYINRRIKQAPSDELAVKSMSSQPKRSAGESASSPPTAMTKPAAGKASPFLQNPLYIYYSANEQGIPQAAYTTLNRVADHLRNTPSARLRIRGYTDSTGTDEQNLAISQQRAYAIKSHLVAKGISADRISAVGLGARNFIASNKTRKLRALNRRVELELY